MTFSIDDPETIERIAEKFELDKETVELIKRQFKSLFLLGGLKSFRAQYLSHLVRAMEIVIREGCDNQLFQIRIETLDPKKTDAGTDLVCAKSFGRKPSGDKKYPIWYFTVYYHPDLDEKCLRVGLAHELGHLYLCTLSGKDPNEAPIEPRSSVFGVLAILEKTDFYKKNPINMEFNPQTPEEVLSMFSLLNNRRQKKYNIS